MMRFTNVSSRATGSLLVSAAIGLLIAGCGPGNNSSSGSPASGGSSGTPTTSAPAQNSGGSGTTLFPYAVGDTWVYRVSLGTLHGTTTNKITALTPVSGGTRATFTTIEHIAGLPSTPTTLDYVFHPDGSITVPFTEAGSGATKIIIKSGGIVWPSQAALESGTAQKSTLVSQIKSTAISTTVHAHVTVKGGGTQSVTVPAGTYQATVVNESVSETVEGIPTTIVVRTWLAPGIGPIQDEILTGAIGTKPTTINVLTSFTKG
jgi:hypothetical protein